jgi:hypothetical protein
MFITINNGTKVAVPGTGPTNNWVPQQGTNTPWKFTPGNPEADLIGVGDNQFQLSVPGVITGQQFIITVPKGIPILALQFYIYFSTLQTVSWVFCSYGQIISSQTLMSTQALKSAPHPTSGSGSSKKGGAKKGGAKKGSKGGY